VHGRRDWREKRGRRAIGEWTEEIPSGRSGARQTTGFQGQMTNFECETVDQTGQKAEARNYYRGQGKGTAFPGASRKPVLRRKLRGPKVAAVMHDRP
jgi:hypothetical protein